MKNHNVNVESTTNHLESYIGEIMEEQGLDAKFCAYSLEAIFGKDIHKQVDGFIRFANEPENNLEKHDIMATLCHDLGGALSQDKMMLPRVSSYGDY